MVSSGVANVCAMTIKKPPKAMVATYTLFASAAIILFVVISGSDNWVAGLFTFADMVQCLALLLLAAQVFSMQSVHGISARAVALEAAALASRLASILNYEGYLPVGETGDWLYQAVDLCALGAALWIIYQAIGPCRRTYQHLEDGFPIVPIIVVCYVLAAAFHANINKRPLYDTFWMAGTFLGAVAPLPQLWLMGRNSGQTDALMCHTIAMMAVGRAMNGYFMWYARHQLKCIPYIQGVNHAVLFILGAHLLSVLLVADFAYHYVKALAMQGLSLQVRLEGAGFYV